MRSAVLLSTAALGACSWLDASEDSRFLRSGGSGEVHRRPRVLRFVQRASDAGGPANPLAYPVEVLEGHNDEHC
jgi:hypothetical protein